MTSTGRRILCETERRVGVRRPRPGGQGVISCWVASDTTAALGFFAQDTLNHKDVNWFLLRPLPAWKFRDSGVCCGQDPEEPRRKSLSAMRLPTLPKESTQEDFVPKEHQETTKCGMRMLAKSRGPFLHCSQMYNLYHDSFAKI